MSLKQAGDISIMTSQCHSLEHPQSTSKHWLKRRKIMTVNNKKESWLSHGQDPSLCLSPLSLPFLLLLLSHWIILSPWKLLPCPFDTAMINCSNIKVYMDQCMIVTFSKRSRIWDVGEVGAAWQCAQCRCFHPHLFTGKMQNPSHAIPA